MCTPIPFDEVARLPAAGDNVAIATRLLAPGTRIIREEGLLELPDVVLEGHRFATKAIEEGGRLMSWGLPFGIATQDISPGEYIRNTAMLEALNLRELPYGLPLQPNFRDSIVPHRLNEAGFTPGSQVRAADRGLSFMGYPREGSRGVGTRNVVAVVGVTSRTASFARVLADRCNPQSETYASVDGVVAVAHTEGSGRGQPNNLDLLLRTLAGFVVHPNVGAVLLVDQTGEPVDNGLLKRYLEAECHDFHSVPHAFLTVGSDFSAALGTGEGIVRQWLPAVNESTRQQASASCLRIALQCGGSDAFSGISGNPLVAWVARETIRNGGSANLAETDELIGAESYILENVKDLETARRFLKAVERFKARAAWHGSSAEGNPSGGNKYRGLYNIVLKSLGAAMKRHPEVRLDAVLDYAEPMTEAGYYFMDSPGNDLESIAGQVASGCNMIFFVTGNGSVTNFPFVPTLKVVTTSGRFGMLADEMDVNAGAYLDGTPMPRLGREMYEQTLAAASGRLSKGEEAGHAQVSIWRNWQQRDTVNLDRLRFEPVPDGRAIPLAPYSSGASFMFRAIRTARGTAVDAVGLVVPTSLCSSEVARMAANRFNAEGLGKRAGLTRFAALTHTEGCGVGGGPNEALYARTLVGYLRHPSVHVAVLLEHGCEKTHNDYVRNEVTSHGLEPEDFGWVSIQMDGGIEGALDKAAVWFRDRLVAEPEARETPADLASVTVGILADAVLDDDSAVVLSRLARELVSGGGTVIVPDTGPLLSCPAFLRDGLEGKAPQPTLAHGEAPSEAGFHVMAAETEHFVETVTGLGGSGAQLVIALAAGRMAQGHPLVPVIQVSGPGADGSDADIGLSGDVDADVQSLVSLLVAVASRKQQVVANRVGNVDIQFTRGLLGISM